MRKLGKWLLIVVGGLAVLLVIAISVTIGWRPFLGPKSRPLTSRTFERTPQRLERGKYWGKGCIYCHSPHDWAAPGAPIVAGMEGSGEVEPYANLPGRIVAPNLTPDPATGTANWTDDQFARAIREGIGHDGRALFPLMPYLNFREFTDEDVASIVVFIRSLPPVHHELPKTEIIFPVKYLIRSLPQPITAPVGEPEGMSDPVKRGARLVKLGGCADCHTPSDKGEPVRGMDFAGGAPFVGPWGSVAPANITPDPSGISYYDEALFLQTIRTGMVKARELSPIMPVQVYRNLSDDDLKAIFAYLRTVKPVHHRVDNSLPPTFCKLCRLKHGGGDQN